MAEIPGLPPVVEVDAWSWVPLTRWRCLRCDMWFLTRDLAPPLPGLRLGGRRDVNEQTNGGRAAMTMPVAIPPYPAFPPDRTVDAESWLTITKSETTGRHDPLTPARDPVGASPRCPVTWAGTCRTCRRPIWSSVWPGKGPKYCRGDGGPSTMRLWEPRAAPAPVTKTPLHREIPGPREVPFADPHQQRGFETGFITSGTPRTGAQRGGRPRVYPVADPAARHRAAARAYRARRSARLVLPVGAE